MEPLPLLPNVHLDFNTTYDTSKYDTISNLVNRIETCKSCPELNSLNMCKQCGCFMPLKVRIKSAECPLKKWNRIEGIIPETREQLKKIELDNIKNKLNSNTISTAEKEIYHEIFKRIDAG